MKTIYRVKGRYATKRQFTAALEAKKPEPDGSKTFTIIVRRETDE